MAFIKKLAGETAIYGISHIFTRILFFVLFTPYLTRSLKGTGEYGIYSDMYAYSTIILAILVFRLDTAFFRFGSKGDLYKVFSTGFLTIALFASFCLAILLFNVGPIAKFLTYELSPHYIVWFAFILFFDTLATMVYAKLRLESRPYRFLLYKVINVVVLIGGVLFFMEFLPRFLPETFQSLSESIGVTRKVDFVFYANLLASASVLLLMLPEFRKLQFKINFPLLKKMLWYALPLVLVGIAGSVNQTFATPLQKYFLGSDVAANLGDAGVYAAAAKLAILLNLFTTAFNYAAEPFFFKNSDNKNAKLIYGKVATAFAIVACFVTLGIVGFIDVAVLLLGEEYRTAAYIVPFLLFAYIFLGLYYNVSIWYKLKDKTHIGALISLFGMFVTIAFSLCFLPKIGTVASAYAALLCYVSMVFVGYKVGQKYYPVQYQTGKVMFYVGATAVASYAFWQLRIWTEGSWWYYLSVVGILAAAAAVIYGKEKELLKV